MKKYKNHIISSSNLLMDILSFILNGIVVLMGAISLIFGKGPIWFPVACLAFLFINRWLKDVCSDKISIRIDDKYLSLPEIILGSTTKDECPEGIRIKCNGIAEYSIGDISPNNIIETDEIYLNLLAGGKMISVVGKKGDEEVYCNIAET